MQCVAMGQLFGQSKRLYVHIDVRAYAVGLKDDLITRLLEHYQVGKSPPRVVRFI